VSEGGGVNPATGKYVVPSPLSSCSLSTPFAVSPADIQNPIVDRPRREISKARAGRSTKRGNMRKGTGGKMMCEGMSGREGRRFGRQEA